MSSGGGDQRRQNHSSHHKQSECQKDSQRNSEIKFEQGPKPPSNALVGAAGRNRTSQVNVRYGKSRGAERHPVNNKIYNEDTYAADSCDAKKSCVLSAGTCAGRVRRMESLQGSQGQTENKNEYLGNCHYCKKKQEMSPEIRECVIQQFAETQRSQVRRVHRFHLLNGVNMKLTAIIQKSH